VETFSAKPKNLTAKGAKGAKKTKNIEKLGVLGFFAVNLKTQRSQCLGGEEEFLRQSTPIEGESEAASGESPQKITEKNATTKHTNE
jgi:hypothetical protein